MATLNLVQARYELNEARTTAVAAEMPRPATAEERGLTAVAMGGAALGAIGGAILGAPLDGLLPAVVGALGTMLGSVSATGAWCLFSSLRSNR